MGASLAYGASRMWPKSDPIIVDERLSGVRRFHVLAREFTHDSRTSADVPQTAGGRADEEGRPLKIAGLPNGKAIRVFVLAERETFQQERLMKIYHSGRTRLVVASLFLTGLLAQGLFPASVLAEYNGNTMMKPHFEPGTAPSNTVAMEAGLSISWGCMPKICAQYAASLKNKSG